MTFHATSDDFRVCHVVLIQLWLLEYRSSTAEESEILDRWQRGDNLVCYRRARTLRLSEADWRCPAIAEVLARQEPPSQEGRATWTLHGLAKARAARFEHIDRMSHEAVRRLLKLRAIAYYRAKTG